VGRYDELPNLVGNPNTIAMRTDEKWFNTAAYQLPAFGTAGNANRSTNLFSDPLFNWDSAFIKRWPFGENESVEFRAEFFNILNLSTFDPPASFVNEPNFGVVNATRQNGREIQFALKFHF
jgi:hypothetical protein